MKPSQYPSQEYLNSILEYRDGGLYWKQAKSYKKIGDRAGSDQSDGYRKIGINGKNYKEHRLIWIYHYGEIQGDLYIDHINRVRNDNRIENLRLVDKSLNNMNREGKNIDIVNRARPYRAHYRDKGKIISKSFYTEQEASEWVAQKKSEIFQNFQESGA